MKTKQALLFCMVLIMSLPGEIWAAKWQFIGFNRYRDAMYIDEERVKHVSEDTVQLWVRLTMAEKSLFRRVMKEDFEQVPKKVEDVKYLEMEKVLDCKGQRIKHLELVYYNYKNRPILKFVPAKAPWKTVVPGSLWHELLRTSCEKFSPTRPKSQ